MGISLAPVSGANGREDAVVVSAIPILPEKDDEREFQVLIKGFRDSQIRLIAVSAAMITVRDLQRHVSSLAGHPVLGLSLNGKALDHDTLLADIGRTATRPLLVLHVYFAGLLGGMLKGSAKEDENTSGVGKEDQSGFESASSTQAPLPVATPATTAQTTPGPSPHDLKAASAMFRGAARLKALRPKALEGALEAYWTTHTQEHGSEDLIVALIMDTASNVWPSMVDDTHTAQPHWKVLVENRDTVPGLIEGLGGVSLEYYLRVFRKGAVSALRAFLTNYVKQHDLDSKVGQQRTIVTSNSGDQQIKTGLASAFDKIMTSLESMIHSFGSDAVERLDGILMTKRHEIRTTFVGRRPALDHFMGLPIVAACLEGISPAKSSPARLPFIPALLAMPGIGKSRFLVELAQNTALRDAAAQHGMGFIPIPVTFNNGTSLDPDVGSAQEELALRIVFSMFSDTYSWKAVRQACRTVGIRDAQDALHFVVSCLSKDMSEQAVLVLLIVDEVTKFQNTADLQALLTTVSNLNKIPGKVRQKRLSVLPVVAGTRPLEVKTELKSASGRHVANIPLPLLTPDEVMEMVSNALDGDFPSWRTHRTLRLSMLLCGGHPRALHFLLAVVCKNSSKDHLDTNVLRVITTWLEPGYSFDGSLLPAKLLLEIPLSPREISRYTDLGLGSCVPRTPTKGENPSTSEIPDIIPERFQVAPYTLLTGFPHGEDSLGVRAMYLAACNLTSGESFEHVVAATIVMRVRCFVALGRKQITLEDLFGRELTASEEPTYLCITGCATISCDTRPEEDLHTLYGKIVQGKMVSEPAVYYSKRRGAVGGWDILVVLGRSECIAVQCKFSDAVVQQPYLPPSIINTEMKANAVKLRALRVKSPHVVFVCQYPCLIDEDDLPSGVAVVDARAGRQFYSHVFAELIAGMLLYNNGMTYKPLGCAVVGVNWVSDKRLQSLFVDVEAVQLIVKRRTANAFKDLAEFLDWAKHSSNSTLTSFADDYPKQQLRSRRLNLTLFSFP